jgi:hypothetical protein
MALAQCHQLKKTLTNLIEYFVSSLKKIRMIHDK